MTELETSALAGGIAGGMLATVGIAMCIFYVLLIIANWKIFTKAGEAGWKSLIPIYSTYVAFKICKLNAGWFIAYVVFSILASLQNPQWLVLIGAIGMICVLIYSVIKLADAFGKGTGFKIGLILLPNIFTLILAFGSAEYQE